MKTIITTIAIAFLGLTATAQKVNPLTGTVTMTQPTCNGYSNGEITITPNGGLAPFTYLWSNGETTETISDLSAGNYSVLVTDAAGQTLGGVFTVPQPEAISIQGITTNTPVGVANGSIDITSVNGVVGNYSWEWSTNTGLSMDQSSLDQTNLKVGEYKLTITDANGCQGVNVFKINKTIVPFSQPGFTIPGVSNNPSSINTNNTENNGTQVLDMMGKQVDLNFAPTGYYLVVENGVVTQKIYKN